MLRVVLVDLVTRKVWETFGRARTSVTPPLLAESASKASNSMSSSSPSV